MRVDPRLCVTCKGNRRLCGLEKCPILERIRVHLKIKVRGDLVDGASPPFSLVGEAGYPKVMVGSLISENIYLARLSEDHSALLDMDLSRIIEIRASLMNLSSRYRIRGQEDRNLEEMRLSAMSSIPVLMEAKVKAALDPRIKFDGLLAPVGPTARVERIRLEEEPKVPRRVDQLVFDQDVRAFDAAVELYTSGIDVYHITRLLSLGLLGRRDFRKLVPTRWSITAVDSMLGDFLKRKVLSLPEHSSEVLLYRSEFSDNRYRILIVPGPYRLSVVECWLPRGLWTGSSAQITTNYEDSMQGFHLMDGGHYAMRLPILEHLVRIRRQATCVAVREIGPGYYAPVGNWQIREAVRRALSSKPVKFDSLDEAISSLDISKEALSAVLRSRALQMLRVRRLTDFL